MIAKRWLRRQYHAARFRYVRWRCSFGPEELTDALGAAGVERGDAVLVHSGMQGFAGFTGSVPDLIRVFEDAVSPEGTLLMPTLSMRGSAMEFVRSGKTFDVRTTPSQVGMLTEVFRRSPGVIRSIHPTHSVAVWGKDAEFFAADHYLAQTPCGRGSPFFKLLERRGKIVLAGTGISSLTFYHCVEELIEPLLPQSPFTEERFVVACRSNGQLIQTVPTRFYDPGVSRRRRLQPLEAGLRGRGRWREARAGSLNLAVLDAANVLQTAKELAERGTFCYTPR